MHRSAACLLLTFLACCRGCGEPVERDERERDIATGVEQVDGACSAAPRTLIGRHGDGERCASPADCMPVCCACAGKTGSWLAAACVDGACAPKAQVCALTADTKLCGDGGAEVDGGRGDRPSKE